MSVQTQLKLVPQTRFGGRVLEFEFPGLEIGVAEYAEGPTGVTVFHFPKGVAAAVDARGGAVATVNTERFRLGYDRPTVAAICFAGGASFGLEAVAGVQAEILARRDYCVDWERIPTVPGAVIFDFRGRDNAIYPDKELGRAALRSARSGWFPLGAGGAGRFVHVGKFFGPRYMEQAGQGGAFGQIDKTKIAVFVVVNAIGNIVDRQGRVVRGNRDPETGARTQVGDDLKDGTGPRKREAEKRQGKQPAAPPPENTTLTFVVTNRMLSYRELQRLAVQTHTSMARAIHPFHTDRDGDVLFAVTTAEVDDAALSFADLAAYASELAWDAVLSSLD
jgi:L-aminopeptidase/D-esterase-like protein